MAKTLLRFITETPASGILPEVAHGTFWWARGSHPGCSPKSQKGRKRAQEPGQARDHFSRQLVGQHKRPGKQQLDPILARHIPQGLGTKIPSNTLRSATQHEMPRLPTTVDSIGGSRKLINQSKGSETFWLGQAAGTVNQANMGMHVVFLRTTAGRPMTMMACLCAANVLAVAPTKLNGRCPSVSVRGSSVGRSRPSLSGTVAPRPGTRGGSG